jgi:predicted RNase H-like HicB family nuclease
MGNEDRRPLSVLVTPAADLPGQWVAHCLQLDLMSQGESIEHAFKMICEACELAMNSDLEDDLDPFDREPAPDDAWEPYYRIMKNAVPLSRVPPERRSKVKAIAGEIVATIHVKSEHVDPMLNLVPAWQHLADREIARSSIVPS